MDDTEEYYGATAAYTSAPPVPPQANVPVKPARTPSPLPMGQAHDRDQVYRSTPPQGQFHTTTQHQADIRRPPPPIMDRNVPSQEEAFRLNTPTPSDQASTAHEEQVRLYAASTPSESPRVADPIRTSLTRIVTFAAPPSPRVVAPPPIPLSDATTAVLQEFDEVKMNLQASGQHWSQVISSLKQELAAEEVELKEIELREGPVRKMLSAIEGSKEEQPDKSVVATLRAVVLQAKEARDKIADIKKKIQRVLPKQVLYAKLIALHGTVGLAAEGSDVGSGVAEGETDDDGGEGETEEGEEGEEEDEEGEEDEEEEEEEEQE